MEITAALDRIRSAIAMARPASKIQALGEEGSVNTLLIREGRSAVKVEVNPVLRETLYPAEEREVLPAVEAAFGYARMPILSLRELFAGKLVAALDRQHPRDLFDVKLLLDNEGLDKLLVRAFLVYLVSHDRPIAEVLAPTLKDIRATFAAEFSGMTNVPVTVKDLEHARERLIQALHGALGEPEKAFLLSVKRKAPRFDLIGMPQAAELPAVRWKLLNLEKMAPARHAAALANLERVLAKI